MYNYSRINKNVEFIGYLNGYKGLLTDKKIILPNNLGDQINVLYSFGGTFLGNSRVKLTNKEDCVKKGYIKEYEDPLSVAALHY